MIRSHKAPPPPETEQRKITPHVFFPSVPARVTIPAPKPALRKRRSYTQPRRARACATPQPTARARSPALEIGTAQAQALQLTIFRRIRSVGRGCRGTVTEQPGAPLH